MNVALRKPMTVAEFLAWEQRQELRYEFDGFRPIAMTGGTAAHATIQANLIAALVTHLRGKPCRAFGSHLKIQVAGRIRYPDALVVCTPTQAGTMVVEDPVVIFEILSPNSVNDDLIVKNAEYRATPSVQHYVILQQTHAGATMFSRKGEDWVADVVAGDDGVIALPATGIAIPLTDVYADVALATEAPE